MNKTNNADSSEAGEKVKQRGLGDYLPYATFARFENGVWSNLKMDLWKNVCIPISSHVLHYAKGVFEGMRITRSISGI